MVDRYRAQRDELIARVLDGAGVTATSLRREVASGRAPAELQALVEKIHRTPYRVTDEDVAALQAHYDDDALFELIVSAALGASLERLERGLAALDEDSP